MVTLSIPLLLHFVRGYTAFISLPLDNKSKDANSYFRSGLFHRARNSIRETLRWKRLGLDINTEDLFEPLDETSEHTSEVAAGVREEAHPLSGKLVFPCFVIALT